MEADHDRFDELAVGHVLGGLSKAAEEEFRLHLLGCADCRTRVAELRDIAADLAAAEEDERSRVQVRTEVERRHELPAAEASPTRRLRVGHVLLAGLVVLILAVIVLFWNLHLRTVVQAYDQAMVAQADALSELASGTSVPVELEEGVTGIVIDDGDRVAFTLTGVDVQDGEVVVAWALDATGDATPVTRAPAALVREGNLAGVFDRADIVELVVTVQEDGNEEGPTGRTLARSAL